MFTTLKKQIFMLFLVIGMIAPVSAMDQKSPDWFGWRSVAGISVLVGAGALWAYYAWTKPVSKKSGSKKVTKQPKEEKDQVIAISLTPTTKTPEDSAYAEQLEHATPEFYASEKLRLDTLIAQLDREIAQERNKK